MNLRHGLYCRRARWTGLLLALLLGGLLPLAAPRAQAQTTNEFLVNSTEDAVDADLADDVCDADPGPAVKCTLRAAVIQSNVTPGKQTIRLQPLIYRLTIAGANDGQSFTGDLDLTQDVDIIGSVAGKLRSTIDASGLGDSVFQVSGSHVNLQNLTITGGGVTNITGPTTFTGGAIFNSGILTLSDSLVRNNTATDGSAIYNTNSLTIERSTISDNHTIAGGTPTASKNEGGAIFNSGTLTLSDSLIRNNTAVRGGGIRSTNSLTIERSTISDNRTIASGTTTASNGGGILADYKLTVRDSTIENNTSAGSGGGLSVESGGPIFIERSLFAGNSAQKYGGGIGIEYASGSLEIYNSTLSANHAAIEGGGIHALSFQNPAVLRGSTIAGNSAPVIGGIRFPKADMRNVIVANNTGNNCFITQFVDSTFNLSSDSSCQFSNSPTNKIGVSARLGPLAFNGGPTRTHALLADSPAINGGQFPAPVVLLDQRGALRIPPGQPGGNQHDIGAFEFNAAGVGTFTLTTAASSATAEQTTTLTLTWTHPERWRDLNTVDIQLRHQETMPLWVRFTEGLTATQGISVTNGLALYNSDGTPAGVGEPGSAAVLESDTATLDLAQSRVQGSGPQGKDVRLTLAVRLKRSAAGQIYALTLVAGDDDGTLQTRNSSVRDLILAQETVLHW